jgi:predicted DNA-binding antitoxin AbrB/MazE fold protein
LIRVLYLTIPFFLRQIFCLIGEKGLSADPVKTIRDADFVFENIPIKIVANRDSPIINLPGVKIGPFKEGKEYEVRFWVAQELKKSGIVHIREEEPLDLKMLNKIQWKEGFQTAKRLTALPEDFYPKLRRYLEELNGEAIKKPERRENFEKAKKLADDITRTRLKKIVSLASSPAQTRQILGNLAKEELTLYNYLHTIISKWRSRILKARGDSKT